MRLIVVANRLPVTVGVEGDRVTLTPSVGGLATGLAAYAKRVAKGTELLFVGWPGTEVPEGLREDAVAQLEKHGAVPIFLDAALTEQFYDGFCNRTLWPLFHYFPSFVTYQEGHYNAYAQVNELFAQALERIVRPGDVIWVHDYQLLLLPEMLRRRFPEHEIGFFLHIPFPTFELFQLLPRQWQQALLRGMLGADLIGFHTHDYGQHFLRCVLRILGLEHKMGTLLANSHAVKVDTFPISIDFGMFHGALDDPAVIDVERNFRDELRVEKVILSIDRLDYSKGIPERLLAYEQFLTLHPQWKERVTLAMVVVPSRVGVDQYQRMKKELDELVGRINGRFSTLTWAPVRYQYRSLDLKELCAYYGLSDVALVTPLRDGMNLIAKEYVATRRKGGVLVLSEMAGAAKEMGEAIIVNPNDTLGTAAAIKEALEMPQREQELRIAAMQERLVRYDVVHWANEFLDMLHVVRNDQERLRARVLSAQDRAEIVLSYRRSQHRLLLLDYDGTLVEFAPRPELAMPDAHLMALLQRLSGEARVIIVSGRDRQTLERWFGSLPVGIIAEHGAYVKDAFGPWEQDATLQTSWKQQLRPILERYADRLPGSFIEEKDFSLVLHYRMADPELSSVRMKELLDDLTSFTSNIDVQVLQGHKVVEVRNSGVNKGRAVLRFLGEGFVLALGDDWTDEDLFAALPQDAYSIRVGIVATCARYNIRGVAEARALLDELGGDAAGQARAVGVAYRRR